MASSSQWCAQREWRVAPGESWDDWGARIDHIIHTQDAYIHNIQVELAALKHEVRQLTATMSMQSNTLPNSSSSSSPLPNPLPSMQQWALAIPAPIQEVPPPAQRPCQHGMVDQFRYTFTALDMPEFNAYHDPNGIAWQCLQSLANKNNMQWNVLDSRFKKCQGLRIQRFGKRTQTARFACTNCGRCTGEISARKEDSRGEAVEAETNDEITHFWRWFLALLLHEPCLEQPAVQVNNSNLAPAARSSTPPPPPNPPPQLVRTAPMAAPAQVPLQAQEVPVSSTAASSAPAPLVPTQKPVQVDMVVPVDSTQEPLPADLVEAPLAALIIPVTINRDADNEFNLV